MQKKYRDKCLWFLNFGLFFIGLFFCVLLSYVRIIFGKIEIEQLFEIFFNNIFRSFSFKIVYGYMFVSIVIPLILTCLLFYFFIQYNKKSNKKLFLLGCFLYVFGVIGIGVLVSWYAGLVANLDLFYLYLIGAILYICIVGRDFSAFSVFLYGVVFIIGVFIFVLDEWKFSSYDDEFCKKVEFVDTKDIKIDEKRNIIVVFAESFRLQDSIVKVKGEIFKIADEDGIKFSNFIEGREAQNTYNALFSLLNGIGKNDKYGYIKHISKNNFIDIFQNLALKESYIDYSKVGIGNILANNGYKNIFVQGGNIDFFNTRELLLSQSFKWEDIYDESSFIEWLEYKKTLKVDWYAPKDEDVFLKFKQKIVEVDNEQPFFAVMFTADWHLDDIPGLKNPFFDNDVDILKSTINNFNDFITWFKKQDFYEKTTLVILADHKKMGAINNGKNEKLYNAFFNLPEELKKNANLNRKFYQIDMAPSILEIAGAKLNNKKYGLGVSIFDNNREGTK